MSWPLGLIVLGAFGFGIFVGIIAGCAMTVLAAVRLGHMILCGAR